MARPKALIISSNLEVGGIERSLIGLLHAFDYTRCDVDLMLCRNQGPLLDEVPDGARLLPQISQYSTFERPIIQVLREGHLKIALARMFAKASSYRDTKRQRKAEIGYLILQRSWRLALPKLPTINGQYDIALSFTRPHYVVTHRVNARIKVGWIHTDYRMIPCDGRHEAAMWDRLDHIAAVSNECREAFLERYPRLSDKTMVIENILSPDAVRRGARSFSADRDMPMSNGTVRILSIGRFSYAKGIDQAVIACRALIDCGYKVRWYAIGYGPDELLIRRLILKHRLQGLFVLLGKQINPYPYINACDLYVQPSRYEGKAVTVREAQILGKPVVITRFRTSASQLEEGVDGHICDLGVDGIVAGVRRLIDDSDYRKCIAETAASRDYGNRKELDKIYALIPCT